MSDARTLIQEFYDCHWRTTQVEILRKLGAHSDSRTIEFLARFAFDERDLPFAEAAIFSLGASNSPLASKFLVSGYAACPQTLRPFTAAAIARLGDRALVQTFLSELDEADASSHVKHVEALMLALGELKCGDAVPILERFLLSPPTQRHRMAALISLGKLSRDPRVLDAAESQFAADPLEWQLFSSVRAQVQFRAQWKLEDYISKLFEAPSVHRALPLELNGFKADDVKEAFKLYDPAKFSERLCSALARIDFTGSIAWYAEFFPLEKLEAPALIAVFESLKNHWNKDAVKIIDAARAKVLAADDAALFTSWISSAALSNPEAEAWFRDWFKSPDWKNLNEAQKLSSVNAFAEHALIVKPVKARAGAVSRVLSDLAGATGDKKLQARVLRAAASIETDDKKLFDLAKDSIRDKELASSALIYFEAAPSKPAATAILGAIADPKWDRLFSVRAAAALFAQHELPEKSPELDAFLQAELADGVAEEIVCAALRVLYKHPRKALNARILALLKSSSEQIQTLALIAAKMIKDDSAADALAPLLKSKSVRVSGRALDALCSLPAVRAKRIVIDFLVEKAQDHDVVEKITRSLEPPPTGAEYFVTALNGVLKAHPDHVLSDSLAQLRDRMMAGSKTETSTKLTADVSALEAELKKRIPGYGNLDEQVRTVLRSAEIPFFRKELSDETIDKASSVLEYCKAVDMLLERVLGTKWLFPKLEGRLAEFQNICHYAGLGEEMPSADRVMMMLGLTGKMQPQMFPLYKMRTMAVQFLNGRIVHDRLKVLDGLRAWAVIMLLFCRTNGPVKALIPLKGLSDEQIAKLAQRLMILQDIRNPAAHRQTYLKLAAIDEVRTEALTLMHTFQQALP